MDEPGIRRGEWSSLGENCEGGEATRPGALDSFSHERLGGVYGSRDESAKTR